MGLRVGPGHLQSPILALSQTLHPETLRPSISDLPCHSRLPVLAADTSRESADTFGL